VSVGDCLRSTDAINRKKLQNSLLNGDSRAVKLNDISTGSSRWMYRSARGLSHRELNISTLYKNIRISTDILWRVFHILTEPLPYTFVSENRRNNEALAYMEMLNGPVKI